MTDAPAEIVAGILYVDRGYLEPVVVHELTTWPKPGGAATTTAVGSSGSEKGVTRLELPPEMAAVGCPGRGQGSRAIRLASPTAPGRGRRTAPRP